ncbi:Homoserine dehydrogenase [Anaerohalosphaera lusitana]|uniref:Homoserine dehydrogenase n=1 Tax=Anaerohalosphaera lusitana TaxID=1936003 RepID=A0A1U9NNJ0_9BACT|nr:homoserine dehydrogenase [Anaerohalosphaera lusitana]AQT69298.1 Homoserine dehydrogenase [Anaerohalosphaera lusitana]
MANKVKVGIVGFGTVGTGVAKILLENNDIIKSKSGIDVELVSVVDMDTTTPRPLSLPQGMLSSNLADVIDNDSISIAVELIGGTTVAKDIVIEMLRSGKHVVTANKALIAEHGTELYKVARENNRCIAFEASTCGGTPVIGALRTGLAANQVNALYGILNGTCNFILSNMTDNDIDFPTALKQAQEKGYAEADPTLDINGADTAHKLTILSRIAFGRQIEFSDVYFEGIENTSIVDIRYGRDMGYTLKLLAIAERDPETDKISLRVHPAFIHDDHPLAQIEGPFNAVSVIGHAVGQTMYYGRGAGMLPTASAVVADIIEVALGNSEKLFNGQTLQSREETLEKIDPIENLTTRFYVRVMAKEQPGVVAAYSKILGDHNISISGVLQREEAEHSNIVPVVIATNATKQKNMTAALQEITDLDVITETSTCIRIVDIPEDDIED